MGYAKMMEIKLGGHSVQARLMEEENPEVVKLLCLQLPLTTFSLHTNVSGQAIVLPTPIVYSGPGHMVPRHPGAVYFFAQGQSIVITYGPTNESAPVNKFAQILEQDLPKLSTIGKAVYDDTLASAQHKEVRATVHLLDDDDEYNENNGSVLRVEFDGGWKSASAIFMQEAKRALADEPEEIFTCFAGRMIPSGMGTGGNVLAVWMHLWSCLMVDGPHTLHRFLDDAGIQGMTLDIMLHISRNHLLRPFNHFEFLTDLGLTRFKAWGGMYSASLAHLTSLQHYTELTAAFLTLVNSYLRRVQSRFPFYMTKSFPRITKEEILKLAAILEPAMFHNGALSTMPPPAKKYKLIMSTNEKKKS